MNNHIAIAGVILSLLATATLAAAQEYVSPRKFQAQLIPRPSEPQATYTLLDTWKVGGSKINLVTKRVGPSGVTYTRREIDCSTMVGRTLGGGETVADMMLERPDPNSAVPAIGSSAQLASSAACSAIRF